MKFFFQKIRRLFISRNKEPYLSIYRMLGFYPNNIKLYEQAFTHRSSYMANGKRSYNNERLEFLGDAVLGIAVADILYKGFPRKREGFLTNTRSKIVQRETLNHVALEMGLDKMMIASIRSNTHHNNDVYGNALEALIGAIYLDQGYRKCRKFVQERIINRYIPLEKIARKEMNFKSNILEWGQKEKLKISFDLIKTFTDKEGDLMFQSSVSVEGHILGTGSGYTKKESQQIAAKKAMRKIRNDKNIRNLIGEIKKHTVTTCEDAAEHER